MTKGIILTGGGTCGHIMPNIALLPYLREHFENISYIGEVKSREEKIARCHDLPFYHTDTIKLERRKVWRNLAIPLVLHTAERQAITILKLLEPSVVFSKGGFVSIPTCLACRKLGIPLVIHESDATLGVANKFCARWATRIITSHTETPLADERYIHIGNPIRDEILRGNKRRLTQPLKLSPSRPTVLIVGGSLGSTAINDVVIAALPQLTLDYNVLHITGKNSNNIPSMPHYHPVDYVDNIGDYYAAADIIISRAGASAISEISALGKRVIYIPLPKGNSRGDQIDNAQTLANAGSARIILQENLACATLCAELSSALAAPPPPANYDTTTAARIAALLRSVAK